MKKILLIILCITMAFTLISCSKDNTSENDESSPNKVNSIISSDESKPEDNQNDSMNLEYKGKSVSEVRFNGSVDFNINVDVETLKSLENAENDTSVPDVTLDKKFGTVEIIYTDKTKETLGTLYLSSDKALYLKFDNNKNKDAAYKISNSIF